MGREGKALPVPPSGQALTRAPRMCYDMLGIVMRASLLQGVLCFMLIEYSMFYIQIRLVYLHKNLLFLCIKILSLCIKICSFSPAPDALAGEVNRSPARVGRLVPDRPL